MINNQISLSDITSHVYFMLILIITVIMMILVGDFWLLSYPVLISSQNSVQGEWLLQWLLLNILDLKYYVCGRSDIS